MFFSRLKKFPSIPVFPRVLSIMNECWILPRSLQGSIGSCDALLACYIWCMLILLFRTGFDSLGQAPQPWLWLTILQCCWIPFANVFLRVCMSAFIQEYGFFYSKIICPVLPFFIFLVGEEESTFASFPWQQTDSLLCSWCGTCWRWNPEPHTCWAPAALLNYTPPPPPPQWTSKGKPLAPLSQKTLPCETGP